MNQKPLRVTENEIFREEFISFENIPGQSKLFLNFQSDAENIREFYPEKETPLKEFAEKVLANYEVDRSALCDVLSETNKSFGAGQKTFENIERLREKDCLAIVTGQQAGLFSGALYTIYKIVSAVKVAAVLQKQDIKAVPVFWIAEEDHDFDEVKKTFNLDKTGRLFESENTPQSYQKNYPVGFVALDETIETAIRDLFDRLPNTEFTDDIKELLTKTYQSGENYSSAFAKFLARIFAEYGLIIVSPLDQNLKKLAAPIFVQAIEKSAAVGSALLDKNRELAAKNYQPQVLVTEDFFPFFYQNEKGQRESLRRDLKSGKIKIQQSKKEFELCELSNLAAASPQNFSPNALMRPIVQDYLLPTLTYFGGAAEIAYFAQNSAVYKLLNRPVTPIRHRASFTVVERRHARTLEKYALDFEKLFDGEEKVWKRIVEDYLSRQTAQTFTEVEAEIKFQLEKLKQRLADDEPTLAANLDNRRSKIVWHLDALRKKYHRAEQEKNAVAFRRTESLFAALLPHDALQERTLNALTFLNFYGENFIKWIYEAVEVDEKKHQILYF